VKTNPAPSSPTRLGLFYFMANTIIETEKKLVDWYIKNNIVPYQTNGANQITYLKEYNLNYQGEKRRVDLLVYNKDIERIDLIEFKNKPIELRDVFQIANYYYIFLKTAPEFENCSYCHLIGKSPNSRKIDSLITIGFEKLKLWYFWPCKDGVDIYEQDRDITLLV
jgi:hypothetical protein